MTKLRNLARNHLHNLRLLRAFPFADETEKVSDSLEKAARSFIQSETYARMSERERDTFLFHTLSVLDLMAMIKKLEEELPHENDRPSYL